MASDYDTAGTGSLALLDKVDVSETFTAVGSAELLSEIVIPYAAGVDDRVRRENILRTHVRPSVTRFGQMDSRQLHEQRSGQHLRRRR